MDENNETNVFQLVNGKKKEDGLPQFDYLIETTDGTIKEVYGFPVFAAQYVMFMQEFPDDVTIPVFMIPIHLVKTMELDEDDVTDDELPF